MSSIGTTAKTLGSGAAGKVDMGFDSLEII